MHHDDTGQSVPSNGSIGNCSMRSIGELLNRHLGEEAWIFGKGPGLDRFEMTSAGPLRICINESALIVPESKYFFAHDEAPIERVAAKWPHTCCAVLQAVRATFAVRKGVPEDAIATYEKAEREMDSLDWTPEKIASKGMLLGLSGTVHSRSTFAD